MYAQLCRAALAGTIAAVVVCIISVFNWMGLPTAGFGSKDNIMREFVMVGLLSVTVEFMCPSRRGDHGPRVGAKHMPVRTRQRRPKAQPLQNSPEGNNSTSTVEDGKGERRYLDAEDMQKDVVNQLTEEVQDRVRAKELVEAEAAVERMKQQVDSSLFPHTIAWSVCYNELCTALIRDGEVERAQRLMEDAIGAIPPIHISAACMNAMVVAQAKQQNLAQADAWFKRMLRMGLHIGEESFTSIVDAHLRSGDHKVAMAWLRKARNAGFAPNPEHYHIMLNKCMSDIAPDRPTSSSDAAEEVPLQPISGTLPVNCRTRGPEPDSKPPKMMPGDASSEAREPGYMPVESNDVLIDRELRSNTAMPHAGKKRYVVRAWYVVD